MGTNRQNLRRLEKRDHQESKENLENQENTEKVELRDTTQLLVVNQEKTEEIEVIEKEVVTDHEEVVLEAVPAEPLEAAEALN